MEGESRFTNIKFPLKSRKVYFFFFTIQQSNDIILSFGFFILDAILALIDVEGNYFVVKAYQYTSLLSAMLLDNWSAFVCMILLIVFFKVRYHWSQYLGALVCFAGIGVLLRGDIVLGQKDAITACEYYGV